MPNKRIFLLPQQQKKLRKLGCCLFAFKDELFVVFGMPENQSWFRFY